MPGASEEDFVKLLYQALGEPVGLLVATSDPRRTRQRLYNARARLGDPDLFRLQVRIAGGALALEGGGLVIVKGPAEPPPKAAAPPPLSLDDLLLGE